MYIVCGCVWECRVMHASPTKAQWKDSGGDRLLEGWGDYRAVRRLMLQCAIQLGTNCCPQRTFHWRGFPYYLVKCLPEYLLTVPQVTKWVNSWVMLFVVTHRNVEDCLPRTVIAVLATNVLSDRNGWSVCLAAYWSHSCHRRSEPMQERYIVSSFRWACFQVIQNMH